MTTITTHKTVAAKAIFDEVTHPDFVLPEGFKSPRGVFIKRAIDEAGMSNAGASTYFQNFKNEVNGKGRYWKAKAKAEAQPATAEAK